MAIISKMKIRYLRRAGFPSYSHVELEVELEILLEEGDDARDLRKELFKNMAEDMVERIEPIAAGYRKIEQPKGASKPHTKALLRQAAAEANASRKPATVQGTLETEEPPALLPEEREPGRDLPKYTEEGKRLRGSGQKRFVMNEINLAWVALSDAQIVDTTPDVSDNVNTERQDIRKWLTMTPLDPKFSGGELSLVVESYGKWRGQGLNTQEAMVEVGNDYISSYSTDPSGGSGSADQEAEAGETQDLSGDQGSGDGSELGGEETESDGQHGSDSAGSEEQPEAASDGEAEA